MKRCVVIGSGLGGLSTAVVLARHGWTVTVLEQGTQAGGCLQSFVRKGTKFETGMHFIGSADPGQTLHRLLRFLGIDGLPLSRLDPTAYDVVRLEGEEFAFANGREAFVETLARSFPHERDGLHRYFDGVEQVAAASSLHSLNASSSALARSMEMQTRSVNEVVASVIADPLLQRVLVGNLPLYAGRRDRTPFATHAFITDFYNKSAFRIAGGSDRICALLLEQLQQQGGRILTRSRAERITCNDHQATGVTTADHFYPADLVVAAIHPRRLLDLLPDTPLLRPAYRRRINALPETVGSFTVYLRFHPDRLPYLNRNYYVYDHGGPWDCEAYTDADWPRGFLYLHLCHEANPQYAQAAEIISYLRFDDVARWQGTHIGRRGPDYEAFKGAHAERLIAAVERAFPGTRAAIADVYTSSPLTYLDYTGTERGSLYGVEKDLTLGAACHVQHRTRIPNVLLTGQNVNSHGMLGTLVGTMVTCSDLIDTERLYAEIRDAGHE